MAGITSIQSPVPAISPMWQAIEEVRNDDKVVTPLITKQPLRRMKSNPSKHRKSSILSLSSIMAAFNNTSFSNLGSTFNLACKIHDKNKNGNDNKTTSIENQPLTFNIVGLRGTDNSNNNNNNNNKTNNNHKQHHCHDHNCNNDHDFNDYDTIQSLITHLKKLEEEEKKRKEALLAASMPVTTKADEKTNDESNLFGNDSDSDSSDDSSDHFFGTMEIDSDSDADNDNKTDENNNGNNNNDAKSDKTNNKNEERGICLKTIKTTLTVNNTVKEFKDYIKGSKMFDLDTNVVLQLFYANIFLDDDSKTLGFYGITNNAFILVATLEGKPLTDETYETTLNNIKLKIVNENEDKKSDDNDSVTTNNNNNNNNGTTDPLAALRAFTIRHVRNVNGGNVNPSAKYVAKDEGIKRYDFDEMLNNFEIERMSCFDFYTFETNDNCIKMPCGHGINEESLLAYALSQVDSKNTDYIRCPQLVKDEKTGKELPCKEIWHYPIIKKILIQFFMNNNNHISKVDLLNFMKLELLSSRNFIQEHFDVQKCGHCNSILFRKQSNLSSKLNDFQAVCPMCTNINRKKYIAENNNKISQIELKIKQLKRPQIIKTITKAYKSLEYNTMKAKFGNMFIESNNVKEIESNSERYYEKHKLRMKRKRYRQRRKALNRNVLKVPSSFLNAFRTDSDYDSSDNEDNNMKDIKKEKFENPYLHSINSGDESSDYEYITTDDDNESESDDEVSVAESYSGVRGLFSDNDIKQDNNSDDDSDSDIETEAVAQQRVNLFKGDMDSDSDNDDDNNDNSENNKEEVKKTIVRIRSKDEIEIDLLESELDKLRNKDFSIDKYNVIFCWGCNIAWQDVLSPACGNNECSTSFRSQILSILSTCETKQIGSQAKIPSVRACPKCGQLITHWEACKHMQCRRCETQFCFVCLKKYLKKTGWQCGSYSSKCPDGARPRQTCDDLPSMNVATVKLFDF